MAFYTKAITVQSMTAVVAHYKRRQLKSLKNPEIRQNHDDKTRDLRIVFFVRIELESNRSSDSFSNRIFESNRPYI